MIEQTREKKIPANLWPYVASSLTEELYQYRDSVFGSTTGTPSGGDLKSIHINFGNQDLYTVVGSDTYAPDHINQQVSLIDELLSANNDSTAFFARLGDLVVPGPTWTNVNDFRAVLVDTP